MQVFDVPFDQPPRWKVWLARIFGEKRVGRDGDTTVTGFLWRGALYIVDYRHEMKGPPLCAIS